MNARKAFLRVLTVIAPLGLTPLLGWLIAEDYLSFGGGDKDIVILIPWVLWSFIYAVASIVMWVRRAALKRSILWSLGTSTAVLLLIWVVLLLLSTGEMGSKI